MQHVKQQLRDLPCIGCGSTVHAWAARHWHVVRPVRHSLLPAPLGVRLVLCGHCLCAGLSLKRLLIRRLLCCEA